MRGKRSGPRGAGRVPASTPAYAGQTGRQWCGGCGGGLYPRICGANPIRLDFPGNKPPLPPHMRGKLCGHPPWYVSCPSTPAYAGQTGQAAHPRLRPHLYPRICGANSSPFLFRHGASPLPPHMRGKRNAISSLQLARLLYPRICGANSTRVFPAIHRRPLPPHMRGKPDHPHLECEPAASTPAYAGQTPAGAAGSG